jgi:hypothetical protein
MPFVLRDSLRSAAHEERRRALALEVGFLCSIEREGRDV